MTMGYLRNNLRNAFNYFGSEPRANTADAPDSPRDSTELGNREPRVETANNGGPAPRNAALNLLERARTTAVSHPVSQAVVAASEGAFDLVSAGLGVASSFVPQGSMALTGTSVASGAAWIAAGFAGQFQNPDRRRLLTASNALNGAAGVFTFAAALKASIPAEFVAGGLWIASGTMKALDAGCGGENRSFASRSLGTFSGVAAATAAGLFVTSTKAAQEGDERESHELATVSSVVWTASAAAGLASSVLSWRESRHAMTPGDD